MTLEQALPLLDAREARGTGTRKKPPAKPKKVAAKKAAPEPTADAAAKPVKAKSPKKAKAAKSAKSTKAPKAAKKAKPAKAETD